MLWAQAEDVTDRIRDNWIWAAVVVGLIIALFVIARIAGSRKKKPPDLEKALREDLRGYPPPPATNAPRRLTVNGEPVRLRLVVVAPTGKLQEPITPDQVPELLDEVFRGLGGYVQSDKPRIKIWPPQLSVAGFAPTFHRLVQSPDPEGSPSQWVKLAGPARTRQHPILLGLALLADQPCKLGDLHVETTEWGELLYIPR
jgi:hypothetical protein